MASEGRVNIEHNKMTEAEKSKMYREFRKRKEKIRNESLIELRKSIKECKSNLRCLSEENEILEKEKKFVENINRNQIEILGNLSKFDIKSIKIKSPTLRSLNRFESELNIDEYNVASKFINVEERYMTNRDRNVITDPLEYRNLGEIPDCFVNDFDVNLLIERDLILDDIDNSHRHFLYNTTSIDEINADSFWDNILN